MAYGIRQRHVLNNLLRSCKEMECRCSMSQACKCKVVVSLVTENSRRVVSVVHQKHQAYRLSTAGLKDQIGAASKPHNVK